jgi:hypothetical protein
MNIVEHHTGFSLEPQVTDRPVFLWLEQNLRKLQGKPMLQEEILDRVVTEAIMDENLVGILLFGSLASGTHTWKSDIDIIYVYETCEPSSGVTNIFVDGVVVQYFFTSYEILVQNQEAVPYLLKQYFAAHPEIEAEWMRFKDLHQTEKNGPACTQTTIFQRWDELEDKYSGGVRKRTFFRI